MSTNINNMLIGGFMPMTNGLGYAVRSINGMGGNCLMIYTGSPRSAVRSPLNTSSIQIGHEVMEELNIDNLIVHAPYTINIANPDDDVKWEKSVNLLQEEFFRADAYKAKALVVHPGSYLKGTPERGLDRLVSALNIITNNILNLVSQGQTFTPTICLETMAGKGHEIGVYNWHFEYIYERLDNPDMIGICMDTCHMSDAGYDISNDLSKVLDDFDKTIGLNRVKVIHVNGSLNVSGSHKDRHANILDIEGKVDDSLVNRISPEAIKDLCNRLCFKDVPKILETPWKSDIPQYKTEIEYLTH